MIINRGFEYPSSASADFVVPKDLLKLPNFKHPKLANRLIKIKNHKVKTHGKNICISL